MSVLPNLKKDTKEKDAKEKRHERNTKTKKEGKGSGSSASSASTKELWGRHAKWRPKKEKTMIFFSDLEELSWFILWFIKLANLEAMNLISAF